MRQRSFKTFQEYTDLIDQHEPDLLYSDGSMPFQEYGYSVVAHLYNMSARRNGQRVAGAALTARVLKQVRDDLADRYGLPMSEYTAWVESWDDGLLIMAIRFTRKGTDDHIDVGTIYPDYDGNVMQSDRPELS